MKRNVLLIMVGSLRADHCWGDDRLCRTPTLDRLCSEAAICTQAFSTASIITTCTTSILTGTYPFVHGINTFVSGRLRPTIPTLAEVFRANGYHTWAEMTGPLESITGLDRGFDDYRHRAHTEWLDTAFGDALLARIQDNPRTPWFGFLHLWELRHPRRITPAYDQPAYGRNSYERAVSSLDHQFARILEAVDENTLIVLTGDHGEYLSGATANALVTQAKRVTSWLKQRSPAIQTLRQHLMPQVVKTLGHTKQRDMYRAWLGHGFHVYDSLVHVPLIFYGPGVFPAGTEVRDLASHIDIFPTLVAALGLAHHAPLSGVNLMPSIQQPGSEWHDRAIYLQASGMHGMVEPASWLAGIRTERYKYVRSWSDRDRPEELYDLKYDPAERINLAPERPDLVQVMRARLDEVIQSAPEPREAVTAAFTAGELDRLSAQLHDLGYVD